MPSAAWAFLIRLLRKEARPGRTVMEYMAMASIEWAKIMIRENADNMTEISRKLGFNSVHYFSRAFKKSVHMSPTEYARTVKVRLRSGQEHH
jgi:YesN/AraC family two-component response regulator